SSITLKFLFIIALLANLSEGFFLTSKVQISITNSLSNNKKLIIHCKSKNKDLNIHVIQKGETYEFKVENSFWGRTLYFCGFKFDHKLHMFDIYVQSRDDDNCLGYCEWEITESGPCLTYNPHRGIYTYCFYW
ncbi:hypothetical protein RND81_08G225500, partial [Saponaria officinalis]